VLGERGNVRGGRAGIGGAPNVFREDLGVRERAVPRLRRERDASDRGHLSGAARRRSRGVTERRASRCAAAWSSRAHDDRTPETRQNKRSGGEVVFSRTFFSKHDDNAIETVTKHERRADDRSLAPTFR
jgi:hypothetical protein